MTDTNHFKRIHTAAVFIGTLAIVPAGASAMVEDHDTRSHEAAAAVEIRKQATEQPEGFRFGAYDGITGETPGKVVRIAASDNPLKHLP